MGLQSSVNVLSPKTNWTEILIVFLELFFFFNQINRAVMMTGRKDRFHSFHLFTNLGSHLGLSDDYTEKPF